MTPKKLKEWLETEESKRVGYKENDGGESVGLSGAHIVRTARKEAERFYRRRYQTRPQSHGLHPSSLAQKPKGDPTDTNWRYSLMNWGHDPKKEK